jgi:TRAP-type C4-dicarboxylate transport system permease small subunit
MLKILDKIEDFFVAAGLGIMLLVLTAQIFSRYLLNRPLIWSEEMARYIFVWVAFIGASFGVRHKSHITLDFFVDRMPVGVQRVLGIVLNILAICAFAFLIPVGVLFTIDQIEIASSAMQIPMALVVVAVPIGAFLTCIRLAVDTVQRLKMKGGEK